jgi:uncharacterized membrane protein SpoIIM required for sporulation/ABC-type transport system involved in multi-copper enzyme maturation permease subunit
MLARLRPAFMVTRREVRDQLRDWRIIIPIVVLTLAFPALMNFTAERAVNFVGRFGADIIGERLVPFLLMVVGFFPISVSLVIALESFVGEKERGSIEPLLSSPLSDWQLYLGKLIAVMVPPLIASYLGITVYLIGIYRDLGLVLELDLVVQILVLTLVQALVMVSGAVVISTQATSVRAANLLASFIIIPVAFLIQGESMVMFWGEYDALWWAVIGLAVISFLLVRTGVGHFNREELLGRELDVLNFGWLWRTFVNRFKGKAASLVSWYRVEILATLRQMKVPILIVFLLVVAGLLIGVYLSNEFVLPPEVVEMLDPQEGVIENLEFFSLFSTRAIPFIWLQNIRALLLATFLGLFSYSVLGLMVIMLPFVVIGYFMAVLVSAGIPVATFFFAFVLPHGILEIPAIVIAGASILHIGTRLAAPADGRSISEGLLHSFADWAKIMVGVVLPLLLMAAIFEALVTPRVAILFIGG